jgi:hypothetical protein
MNRLSPSSSFFISLYSPICWALASFSVFLILYTRLVQLVYRGTIFGQSHRRIRKNVGWNAGPDVSLTNKVSLYFQCMLLLQQTSRVSYYLLPPFFLTVRYARGGRGRLVTLAVLILKSRSQPVWSWTGLLYTAGRTPWTEGGGISPSQGRYLHAGQHKHRINIYKHPCLQWDSNPRFQRWSGRRLFMPHTARPLWSASIFICPEEIKVISYRDIERYSTGGHDLNLQSPSKPQNWYKKKMFLETV